MLSEHDMLNFINEFKNITGNNKIDIVQFLRERISTNKCIISNNLEKLKNNNNEIEQYKLNINFINDKSSKITKLLNKQHTLFKCVGCSKTFQSKDNLNKHFEQMYQTIKRSNKVQVKCLDKNYITLNTQSDKKQNYQKWIKSNNVFANLKNINTNISELKNINKEILEENKQYQILINEDSQKIKLAPKYYLSCVYCKKTSNLHSCGCVNSHKYCLDCLQEVGNLGKCLICNDKICLEMCILCYNHIKKGKLIKICSNKHSVCKQCNIKLNSNKVNKCPYCREQL